MLFMNVLAQGPGRASSNREVNNANRNRSEASRTAMNSPSRLTTNSRRNNFSLLNPNRTATQSMADSVNQQVGQNTRGGRAQNLRRTRQNTRRG